jgi:phosphohistidine phosphatase
MRHAKSDWRDPSLDDFDRPLNDRGTRAAPAMGAYLHAALETPDHALCSPAKRAVQTWDLIAPEFTPGFPVTWSDDLYMATPAGMLKVIGALTPPDATILLVIGHNPGIEQLAAGLAGPGSDADALARLRGKFPTTAVAVLEFDARAWTELRIGHGRLTHFVRPRDLT